MSDPLPPAVVQRDPIEYLINAMELAGQHPRPFEQGYVTKRRAVLDAIAALRTRAETAERERDEWRDATVRERIAADIKAAYQRGIGRSPRCIKEPLGGCHQGTRRRPRRAGQGDQGALDRRDVRGPADAALAERDALKAEVTRLYDELGSVSEELGLPRSIGPAPGWLKQQMADLKEARQLLATRVEADRLSEANDEIAALKSALESAAVGLGQSRVDRIAELENEVKTLRVFANAALEHQREAESALDARLLDARLSGNALDDTIVERDEAHAALTEARRVLRAQDECMVCKAELFRDLTVPHCFDCVVDDDHAEEWDAICAAKAAVLAQEVQP